MIDSPMDVVVTLALECNEREPEEVNVFDVVRVVVKMLEDIILELGGPYRGGLVACQTSRVLGDCRCRLES
jgi:hypothetical protein